MQKQIHFALGSSLSKFRNILVLLKKSYLANVNELV